jgi:hypothetical protein
VIIHDIRVDAREIVVGATDLQRWQWELEDGRSHAADAKTLVYVSLEDRGAPHAVVETMGLAVDRQDPLRQAAIEVLPALLEAAWEIRDHGWDASQAREHLEGRRLGV